MARMHNIKHAQADTISFCQAIKKVSGLTNKAIESELFVADADATGRKFSRWLTGKIAMPPDVLQLAIKKAITKKWFTIKTGGIITPQDQRFRDFGAMSERAHEKIEKDTAAMARYLQSHRAAVTALTDLLASVKEVEHNLLFINSQAGEHEYTAFNFGEVEDVVKKLSQLAVLELSPWVKSQS